jgi:protein-tyrosine phosphatase
MALSHAHEADVAALSELGINTVFDLRTQAERERHADRLPRGAKLTELDVLQDSDEADPSTLFDLMRDPTRASAELANGGTERFYRAAYRDMVLLPSAREAYGRLFRGLANAAELPALVHCTAGKDRTGWAVAALLLYLGVRPDAVMREYLLSDAEVRAAFAPAADAFVVGGGDREVYEPLMGVRPSLLDTAIDTMHRTYGSIDAYVRDGLGIDAETEVALRVGFLEHA